jgi:hypothetical protein
MNNQQVLAILGLTITIWLAEVVYVKVRNGEPVPFWLYGIQAASLATVIYYIFGVVRPK